MSERFENDAERELWREVYLAYARASYTSCEMYADQAVAHWRSRCAPEPEATPDGE